MQETQKLPFFQRPEFGTWMITTFFHVFIVTIFVFLPIAGAHSLGITIEEELESVVVPVTPAKREPRAVQEGPPVAFRLLRTGP